MNEPQRAQLGKFLSAFINDDGKVVIECEDTYYDTVLTDGECLALGDLCLHGQHRVSDKAEVVE